MKSLKVFCLRIILGLMGFSLSVLAEAGRETGNGGDTCENRIQEIASDIDTWILNDGPQGLTLPEGISLSFYKDGMRQAIAKAQVSCTSDKVIVGQLEKTCKNYIDDQGIPQINCNYDRLNGVSLDEQYVLVHHEYAGVAGFEVNEGDTSQYSISNQISGFLESKTVRRLAVKKSSTPDIDITSCSRPVEVRLSGDTKMKFCEIPAGSALIGNLGNEREQWQEDQMPVFERRFKGFQIGQFTVTQKQYKAVMDEEPWKENGKLKSIHAKEGDFYPAVYVSYLQARQFARVMNLIDPSAEYRLPTEAEWEYAARAGTTTEYYWGDKMESSYAFYWDTSCGIAFHIREVTSCPVADLDRKYPGYCANGFGLMQMVGNVFQWTSDEYKSSYVGAPTDGNQSVVDDQGSDMAVRGASYESSADGLRSAKRMRIFSGSTFFDLGFRLVRVPK